jgi:membrane fusion protein, heavy metal efflux system
MRVSIVVLVGAIVLSLLAGAAGGLYVYPWLKAKPEEKKPSADPGEFVKISPQARANLELRVEPWRPVKEYWRTLKVPGQVVEREGNCDRLVTARLGGIIKDIAAVRGDLVRPGAPLFTLEVISEAIQTAQAAYYKNHLELKIVADEQRRLADSFKSGALPAARKIELDNQWDKLSREKLALEHELKVRGLTPAEIAGISAGTFLSKIDVVVPPHETHAANKSGDPHFHDFAYEVEDLKVKLGEQVKAGQALCQLAHHYRLQLEGRVFESERTLIQQAAKDGWPVRAEFPHQGDRVAGSRDGGKKPDADKPLWPADVKDLKITFLESKVDAHQTLNFYLPLWNDFQEYERDGKTYRLWRFRLGQRAHLHVPVKKYTNVFAVPADAVVRDGPEAYVFRENGDAFERKPVHVLHSDRSVAIIANDGSILPGYAFALNAAAQLNWALKTQAGGAAEEGHHHH